MLEHKRPLDKPSNVRRIDLTEFSILGPFVNSLFAKSQQHSLCSRDDMTFTDLWCSLVSMTEGWGKMSKSFAFVFQEIYLTYTIFVIKGSMAVLINCLMKVQWQNLPFHPFKPKKSVLFQMKRFLSQFKLMS